MRFFTTVQHEKVSICGFARRTYSPVFRHQKREKNWARCFKPKLPVLLSEGAPKIRQKSRKEAGLRNVG